MLDTLRDGGVYLVRGILLLLHVFSRLHLEFLFNNLYLMDKYLKRYR
jgi:hypothetical protein